jgi:hypothetical protein
MSWLKRLFGSNSGSAKPNSEGQSAPTLEEMNRVIPAFGLLMEKAAAHGTYGQAVFDEATLPAPKARLEFIIFCAIGIAPDDRQAQQLVAGLLHLADYQPGVGPTPVTQFPRLPDPETLTSPEAIRASAAAMSNHSATSRYSSFAEVVERDLLRLKGLADKALVARATRNTQRSVP